MYLRFVSSEIDPDSRVESGVFVAARELRDSGVLPDYDRERLTDIVAWFNEHLREPEWFSRPRLQGGGDRAVCWFRPTANEHIARARELAALLEDYDVRIWTLKALRIGRVVYEDEHQVVAEPYAKRRLWRDARLTRI